MALTRQRIELHIFGSSIYPGLDCEFVDCQKVWIPRPDGHVLSNLSDLTLTEWRILYILRSMSTATMSQIVQESRLDKAQISRSIKALVEKGYIASAQDEHDQRRQLLKATPAGRAIKDKILPIMMRRQEAMTEGLSDEDIDTFLRILDHLDETATRREF